MPSRIRLLAVLLCCFAELASGQALTWTSPLAGEIQGALLAPAEKRDGPVPTVVYLKGLSVPRIGRDADTAIITDLRVAGHLVLVLDYANHPDAVAGKLNADVLKLRDAIAGKNRTLLADQNVDPNRLFFLCEGFRLKRDVKFARDGDRVLAMDIIHPANPETPVPLLIEITCDNKDRMGGFSLLYCRDTLLEGAQLAGFATAMVDHPVRPPYKGIDDPMPESMQRMKAAVAKAREVGKELNLSGKVGAIGFSRGGPFAAILAAQRDVDAALVHGNRYDYLDLLPNDPMLARFEKAWGPREQNRDRWAIHGASTYLTRDSSPMFLNTSNAESPEYRDGLAKFDTKLSLLGIEHVYQVDEDGRGHQVTTNAATLSRIYEFFRKYLKS